MLQLKYYFHLQLSGCGLLGAGLWLRLAYEGYTALLPQQSVLSADNLLIGIGVAMFVVAFFGCCGSWFQSRCMLVMVSVLKFTL
jgi:tetraspanin-9